MAANDPYNANDPIPRRKYPDGYKSVALSTPAQPAPQADAAGGGAGGGGGGGYGAPGAIESFAIDLGRRARNALGNFGVGPAAPIDPTPAAVNAGPPVTRSIAYQTNAGDANQPPVALRGSADTPEGVSRRSAGVFEGKGNFGERAFSDSRFAPEFAGVRNADPALRAQYDARYQNDRGGSNIATEADAFEVARKADLQRAAEDYKAYVAAGSPRTKDGRGLTEYDFLQNQQQQRLASFLDGNTSGNGTRASDRSGDLFGRGGARRDPNQADAIAANDALGRDAKTKQELERGDLAINEAAQGRPDALTNYYESHFKENPGLLKKRYGDKVDLHEAALIESAFAMARRGINPLTTEAGREADALITNRLNDQFGKRGFFQSGRGEVQGPADLSNFSVRKRTGFLEQVNPFTGTGSYEIQGPAYDKSSRGDTLTPVDPNDPNAERAVVGYNPTGEAFGTDIAEYLRRRQAFTSQR